MPLRSRPDYRHHRGWETGKRSLTSLLHPAQSPERDRLHEVGPDDDNAHEEEHPCHHVGDRQQSRAVSTGPRSGGLPATAARFARSDGRSAVHRTRPPGINHASANACSIQRNSGLTCSDSPSIRATMPPLVGAVISLLPCEIPPTEPATDHAMTAPGQDTTLNTWLSSYTMTVGSTGADAAGHEARCGARYRASVRA
jgi:hypothetical protein